MGPSTSTSTIPQFCIQYVKYQNSLANKVTRSDLKNALKQQHKTAPWLFGSSKNGNEPASSEAAMLTLFALVDPNNNETKNWLAFPCISR